jgi:hypothetical protein
MYVLAHHRSTGLDNHSILVEITPPSGRPQSNVTAEGVRESV